MSDPVIQYGPSMPFDRWAPLAKDEICPNRAAFLDALLSGNATKRAAPASPPLMSTDRLCACGCGQVVARPSNKYTSDLCAHRVYDRNKQARRSGEPKLCKLCGKDRSSQGKSPFCGERCRRVARYATAAANMAKRKGDHV